MVGVLDEILVVVHGVLASLACARLLVLCRAFAADGAHVNGLCRLLTVHTLADNDDVRRDGCAAKGLVVHAECSDEVRTALVHHPVAQCLAVVKCTVRGYEDTQTALTQLAHVLGNAEIVDIVELLGKVAVACGIVYAKSCNEWHIGDGQVHAAVGDACLLEALYVHLCIGIEQREYAARRAVYLYGVNVAALAHRGGHLSQDIADTGRAFKDVATFEPKLLCNVPKGINNVCRGVVGTVGTHHGLLVGFLAQQLAYLLVALAYLPVAASIVQSTA